MSRIYFWPLFFAGFFLSTLFAPDLPANIFEQVLLNQPPHDHEGRFDLSDDQELNRRKTRSEVWDKLDRSFDGLFFAPDSDLYLGRNRSSGRVWSNLYFGAGKLEPKQVDYDVKPSLFGVQLGFDVVDVNDKYSTFFFNYTRSSTKFGGEAKSIIENYSFGYGKYQFWKFCHLGGVASISYDKYGLRADERGSGKGMQTNFYGEFGIDISLGQFAIKPFYALQYDFLYHGRIGNKKDPILSDQHEHSLPQLFGVKFNWKAHETAEFKFRTVWVHELLDEIPSMFHARFSPVQGTMTPAVFFYEGKNGRDWAWLGLTLQWNPNYSLYVFFDYDVMLNEYHMMHIGNLGLCLSW